MRHRNKVLIEALDLAHEFRQRARTVEALTFVSYGVPITFETLRSELHKVANGSQR